MYNSTPSTMQVLMISSSTPILANLTTKKNNSFLSYFRSVGAKLPFNKSFHSLQDVWLNIWEAW